jgi:hypothetical protein
MTLRRAGKAFAVKEASSHPENQPMVRTRYPLCRFPKYRREGVMVNEPWS